jgi:Delta3-Delta2-enoyl-CoA isomerase
MILNVDRGAVRELQLNRPPANALSPELIVALKQSVESAPHDGARALVLSGLPGRFSAGLDVPLLLTLDRAEIATLWREVYKLLRALALSPIPIVAASPGTRPQAAPSSQFSVTGESQRRAIGNSDSTKCRLDFRFRL